MKTLGAIQTLSKVGKIISKIIFILCVVGFCACLFGIVGLAVGLDGIKLGELTIHGIVEKEAGMSMASVYAAMSVGALLCAAEAVLCKFAETYFKHELSDGTPFTFCGAKELLRLGILTVAIPVAAGIVCSIGVAVLSVFHPETGELSFGEFSSVGIGIMMIVMSLLCRCGAEQAEKEADRGEEVGTNG